MEQAVQQLFDNAQRIVFLTGAGVSTASGIPDFRSANGLYTKDRNAEYYLSHRYFVSDPEGFYQFCKENLYFPDAKPNIIHQKQAALTQQDRATVITQNIDNLYEEAGTKHLIDFHGNLFNVYCEKCHETVPVEEYLKTRKDEDPALFVGAVLPHKRLGKTSIEKIIKELGERAGISRPVYPHLLRHTFATDMLAHGAQIDQVSKMLGHKQIDTTRIYAKTNAEMMKLTHRMYVA